MGKATPTVKDEVFQLGDNDVVMRLECWDVLSKAAAREGFDNVPEWLLHAALTQAIFRAISEQEDELADELGEAMNDRWPIKASAA